MDRWQYGHQDVYKRQAVRTAIAIPVAALHIQEVLQAAAPVQRNIIMIHTMMVMMMSIWMETCLLYTSTLFKYTNEILGV